MKIYRPYFLLSVLLFLTEVIIALCFNDDFIRPYFGDLLVVILLYCAIKTFFKVDAVKTALFVLAIAIAIEISQYFILSTLLGLQDYTAAELVLGTSFSWIDILMYAAGIAITILFETQGLQLNTIKAYNHETSTK